MMLGMKNLIIFPEFQTQILRRSDESFCFRNGRYFISIWVRSNRSNFLSHKYCLFLYEILMAIFLIKGNACKWNAYFPLESWIFQVMTIREGGVEDNNISLWTKFFSILPTQSIKLTYVQNVCDLDIHF